MLSFRTISYLEGVWNALCGVEYKTRRWDIYSLDLFIIEQIKNGVPIILEDASTDNIWYNDVQRLGTLANELTSNMEASGETLSKYDKNYKEFLELLPKTFTHLWY